MHKCFLTEMPTVSMTALLRREVVVKSVAYLVVVLACGSAAKAVTKCKPGSGWSSKDNGCAVCGSLSYSPDGSQCKTCPVGTYSILGFRQFVGNTACTKCDKKTYLGTPDCNVYFVCEPGKPTKKKQCPEGSCLNFSKKCCVRFDAPDKCVSVRKKCDLGMRWSAKDKTCVYCGSGTYGPDGYQCKTCPTGSYSVLSWKSPTGNKECTTCKKKEYISSGTPDCSFYYVCEPGKPTQKKTCPEGSCFDMWKKCCAKAEAPDYTSKCISPQRSAAKAVKKCKPGSEWSSKYKVCSPCGSLTYSPDGYKCKACPAGTYSILPWHAGAEGPKECTKCNRKEYLSSGNPDCSVHYVCEPGKLPQKKTCPKGSCFDLKKKCCAKYKAPDYNAQCISVRKKCDLGMRWSAKDKTCVYCGSGTYGPDGYQCKTCPTGSYSVLSWKSPTGNKECTTCKKKEYISSGTPDCSFYYVCEPGKPTQKKTCPEGSCFDMWKKCCAKAEAPDYTSKCISPQRSDGKKCQPGKEWSTKHKTCISCGSLTYSPDGYKCRACPAGTYSLAGWHAPEGPKECTRCDKKKFLGSATPDCTVYYMCQPGKPTQERRCPEKTCWNTEKKCCTNWKGKCPPVPVCGYGYEPRPDRSGCKKCGAGYSSPDGKKCRATG